MFLGSVAWADLASHNTFSTSLENGSFSLPNDFLHPFRYGLAAPCNSDSQKFCPEVFAAEATVVTGNYKRVASFNVFLLPCIPQSEGDGKVSLRNSGSSFAVQPKCDEFGCKRRWKGEYVIRDKGRSHDQWKVGGGEGWRW